MNLKTFAPKSLYGRFLMIIVLPVVLVQLVAMYMFYERHWESVTRHMANSLSGEILWLVNALEVDGNQAQTLNRAAKHLGLHATITSEALTPHVDESSLPEAFALVRKHLGQKISYAFTLETLKETSQIRVRMALPSERLLTILTSRKRLTNPTTYIFVTSISITALVLLVVALLFLRGQVRSIKRLARAAEKFGKGDNVEDFKPQGAQEVRRAGAAFLQMKERIQRHIEQRMEMLAGISHDLRTPLTRLHLKLALINNPEVTDPLQDELDEMETMLQEYLDFLRGAGKEDRHDVQLFNFLKDIVESYKNADVEVSLTQHEDTTIYIRPGAFKRSLTNIINNATRYAKHVVVEATIGKHELTITIDDDGPGIPPEKYEEVFEPFFRLDSSRNQETGGAGLGLAIVKDIVLSHGGDIALDKSPTGGLRVAITLPL